MVQEIREFRGNLGDDPGIFGGAGIGGWILGGGSWDLGFWVLISGPSFVGAALGI